MKSVHREVACGYADHIVGENSGHAVITDLCHAAHMGSGNDFGMV